MAHEQEYDVSELKIKEQPAPPGFGVLLGLLAVGLVLAAIRPVALLASLGSLPVIAVSAQLALSGWALVNLFFLLKRKRAFIKSMIAYLAVNLLLLIYQALFTASAMPRIGPLPSVLVGVVAGCLWLLYLVRSQHVRRVCVR